jgi:hypothetical protein
MRGLYHVVLLFDRNQPRYTYLTNTISYYLLSILRIVKLIEAVLYQKPITTAINDILILRRLLRQHATHVSSAS